VAPPAAVDLVKANRDTGHIYHYGAATSGELKTGDKVTLEIDGDRRREGARLHSAGHALDVAMETIGKENATVKALVPASGYHFPDSPYVR
jgi:Ser-tRNA(Ala) deacylase AlaX